MRNNVESQNIPLKVKYGEENTRIAPFLPEDRQRCLGRDGNIIFDQPAHVIIVENPKKPQRKPLRR